MVTQVGTRALLGGLEKDNSLVACPDCTQCVRRGRLEQHKTEPECVVRRVRREYAARGWVALHALHAKWAERVDTPLESAPADVIFEFGGPHGTGTKAVKERPYGPEWVDIVCNLHRPFTPAKRRALVALVAADPDLAGAVGALWEMRQEAQCVALLKDLLRVHFTEHGKVLKHGASPSTPNPTSSEPERRPKAKRAAGRCT